MSRSLFFNVVKLYWVECHFLMWLNCIEQKVIFWHSWIPCFIEMGETSWYEACKLLWKNQVFKQLSCSVVRGVFSYGIIWEFFPNGGIYLAGIYFAGIYLAGIYLEDTVSLLCRIAALCGGWCGICVFVFSLVCVIVFSGKYLGDAGDDESCRLVCRISARGERRLERAWQTQVGSELPAELPDTSTSHPTSSNVWRRGRLEKYVWSSCQSWAPSNVIESQSSVEKWGQICALKIGQLWTNVFKTWLFINFVIAKTRWYRS